MQNGGGCARLSNAPRSRFPLGGSAPWASRSSGSNEQTSAIHREGSICNEFGDNWRRFWGWEAFRVEEKGIELIQRPISAATLIDIRAGDSDRVERLEHFLARFLSDCAGTSALIVDIRSLADEDAFPLASLEHPVKRRGRIIGELPVRFAQKLRLNWFESHYTLLCVGDRISTSDAYAKQALRLSPEGALRKGLIRAYIAGEEIEGYTFGITGMHPEILSQLKEALFR